MTTIRTRYRYLLIIYLILLGGTSTLGAQTLEEYYIPDEEERSVSTTVSAIAGYQSGLRVDYQLSPKLLLGLSVGLDPISISTKRNSFRSLSLGAIPSLGAGVRYYPWGAKYSKRVVNSGFFVEITATYMLTSIRLFTNYDDELSHAFRGNNGIVNLVPTLNYRFPIVYGLGMEVGLGVRKMWALGPSPELDLSNDVRLVPRIGFLIGI